MMRAHLNLRFKRLVGIYERKYCFRQVKNKLFHTKLVYFTLKSKMIFLYKNKGYYCFSKNVFKNVLRVFTTIIWKSLSLRYCLNSSICVFFEKKLDISKSKTYFTEFNSCFITLLISKVVIMWGQLNHLFLGTLHLFFINNPFLTLAPKID